MSDVITPKAKEINPLDDLLLRMDEAIDSGSTVPFSNKKMVDADQLHELIDQIRLDMPTEIKRAKDIEAQKKSIIEQAEKDAADVTAEARKRVTEMIKDAKAEADRLVSQQEIVGRANEYAKEQVERANKEAEEIIAQAREKEKQIRDAMVKSINESLTEASAVLQKNLDAVNTTMEAISKINEE